MRVREAIDSVGGVVTNLVPALRGASALTLLIAVLVLGGALAAGHRHRVYDAVVLKTVGATRGKLLAAYALEYLMLGVATAVFGVAAGTAAAAFVIRQVMNLPFTWLPGPDLAAAAGAVVGRPWRSACSAPSTRSGRSRRRCCGACKSRQNLRQLPTVTIRSAHGT